MTYNQQTIGEAPRTDSDAQGRYGHFDRDPLGWAKSPGFHPLKAVAVVAGFAIFPPLGVAALVWFIFNSRRQHWGNQPYAFSSAGGPGRACGRGRGRTGNSAFDEHRAQVMSDLEKERQDFAAAQDAQRRKRDQEAFEAFRAAKPKDGGENPPSTVL